MIGIDYGLVVPDAAKTLRGGAVQPWQTRAYQRVPGRPAEVRAASAASRSTCRGASSTEEQRRWVIDGEGPWEKKVWYGVEALLRLARDQGLQDAHPRAAVEVPQLHAPAPTAAARGSSPRRCCGGSAPAAATGPQHPRPDAAADRARRASSSTRCALPAPLDEAADLLLGEIRARLDLPRATSASATSRSTASRARCRGGEVQRINLTTALGTSLVNTLFVLDEPTIGLHPRDMRRVIERDAAAARRRQLAARRRARPADHARGRPHRSTSGPGAGRARRARSCFNGTPGGAARRAPIADRRTTSRAASDAVHAAGRRGAAAARRRRSLVVRGAARAQPEGHRRRDPARPPGLRHRRVRLGQVDAGAGRAVRGAAAREGQADRDARARIASCVGARARRRRRAGRPDRRSAARRAPTRRATSARSTRSASASPRSRSRASAATRPARSASTPATAAARPAAATASSTSRCSSCPTSTCAAPTATARATARRSSR